MRQARALGSLGDKPLVVVTADRVPQGHRSWPQLRTKLAALSTNTQHTVADTSHVGILESRDGAAASAAAIKQRAGQPRRQFRRRRVAERPSALPLRVGNGLPR